MHLILLPGNSRQNKEWIEDVESKLIGLFDSSHIHYYKHWRGSASTDIDLHVELKRLQKALSDYDEYMIFAKSAGTMLTLVGVKEGVLKPSKCILVGTAVNWGKLRGLDVDWLLEGFAVPTLFIQQRFDPVISHDCLKNMVRTLLVKDYSIAEIPGKDHLYKDIDTLHHVVGRYLYAKATIPR